MQELPRPVQKPEENVSVVTATLDLYNTVRVYENCHLACVKIADGYAVETWHKTLPVEGVQFHPESILTEHGHELLGNFLKAY